MRILLPPSEGKAKPTTGAPVDLGSLAFAAELGERRVQLLDALERLGKAPASRAVKALGISTCRAYPRPPDAEPVGRF